jgi:hypothetical protein
MASRRILLKGTFVCGALTMLLWANTHPQRLADMEGVFKSLRNTSRAAVILARSVYDYTY